MKLREVVTLSADPVLAGWGIAAALDGADLEALDTAREAARGRARAVLAGRGWVDSTAWVSPHAVLGPGVIVGPGCRIHEFATVRGGSILAADVEIGHGCEVARSVIASHTRLTHHVTVCDAVIGQAAHLAAGVVLGSVHLWNDDMSRPDRPILVRTGPGTIHHCGPVKFGGVLGDRVRVGMGALLGPGLLVGTDAVLYPSLIASEQLIPARTVARPAPTPIRIEPRRDHLPHGHRPNDHRAHANPALPAPVRRAS
jgi:acetyltransferase-like isoleucine patch superfamily enzyme